MSSILSNVGVLTSWMVCLTDNRLAQMVEKRDVEG